MVSTLKESALDTPSRAVPINRGQSKVVQALAGVTMVTGYKRWRRLLLSPVTLRGSGPRVGASVCRMQPQTLHLGLERAERAGPGAPTPPHLRGEPGIRAERQRGCRRDAR